MFTKAFRFPYHRLPPPPPKATQRYSFFSSFHFSIVYTRIYIFWLSLLVKFYQTNRSAVQKTKLQLLLVSGLLKQNKTVPSPPRLEISYRLPNSSIGPTHLYKKGLLTRKDSGFIFHARGPPVRGISAPSITSRTGAHTGACVMKNWLPLQNDFDKGKEKKNMYCTPFCKKMTDKARNM